MSTDAQKRNQAKNEFFGQLLVKKSRPISEKLRRLFPYLQMELAPMASEGL